MQRSNYLESGNIKSYPGEKVLQHAQATVYISTKQQPQKDHQENTRVALEQLCESHGVAYSASGPELTKASLERHGNGCAHPTWLNLNDFAMMNGRTFQNKGAPGLWLHLKANVMLPKVL